MTILVTGATGTVGSQVVKSLDKKGVKVRALVHTPEKAKNIQGKTVETVRGDLNDPASLDKAFEGVEKAFILVPPSRTPAELKKPYVEAAKRAGVKHIVDLVGMPASTDPGARLLKGHVEAMKVVESAGIPFTHVEPSYFMQNLLWQAESIGKEGVFYGPFEDAKIAMIDVRDIGDAAAEVLTGDGHEGKTYQLTGPKAITQDELAKTVSQVIDKPVRYVDVPNEQTKKSFMEMGVPQDVSEDFAELMGDFFPKGGGEPVTDNVKKLTGHEPRNAEQFAKDHVAMFR